MTYSLFGHRDFSPYALPDLYLFLENLANTDSEISFLVGNEGAFDRHVQHLLKKLKAEKSKTDYSIVLAYLPTHDTPFIENSLYPEGLEKTPLKFAILKRNQWMIDNSDAVLYYSERSYGGVATATEYARKKGKILIPLNNN